MEWDVIGAVAAVVSASIALISFLSMSSIDKKNNAENLEEAYRIRELKDNEIKNTQQKLNRFYRLSISITILTFPVALLLSEPRVLFISVFFGFLALIKAIILWIMA